MTEAPRDLPEAEAEAGIPGWEREGLVATAAAAVIAAPFLIEAFVPHDICSHGFWDWGFFLWSIGGGLAILWFAGVILTRLMGCLAMLTWPLLLVLNREAWVMLCSFRGPHG